MRIRYRRTATLALAVAAVAAGVVVAAAQGGSPQPLPRPTPPPATLHPTAAQATATALQNAANIARGYAASTTTAAGTAQPGATADVVTGTTLGAVGHALYPTEGTVGGRPDDTPVTVVMATGSFAPRSTPAGVSVPPGKYLTVTTDDETGAIVGTGIASKPAPLAQLGNAETRSLPAPAAP